MCRSHTNRGVLDGYGLMHELLADVVESATSFIRNETVSAADASSDTWTVVPLLATDHFHANVHGKIFLTLA